MKLSSQHRAVIPKRLIDDIAPLPEDDIFKVFFSESQKYVVLSPNDKKGAIVQIGRARFDSKKRILFPSDLYELIPQLLKGDWEDLYFCLNQKKELCIKKAP